MIPAWAAMSPRNPVSSEYPGICAQFAEQLPKVRSLLATDVQAAFDNDPAAPTTQEIIVSYPCIEAIAVHQQAHELYSWAYLFCRG